MNALKVGSLIRKLRQEKGLSQVQLENKLSVSPKTISKWENGRGCPDTSLWSSLAEELDIDIKSILDGKVIIKEDDIGKLTRSNFYICPSCKNIVFSTSLVDPICCSKHLSKEKLKKPSFNIDYRTIDGGIYLEIDHPMTKDNYILFVGLIKDDSSFVKRLYPEQEASLILPELKRSDLFIYSTGQGLVKYKIK